VTDEQPVIKRRSLSDSLRYLAGKLEVALSDVERAGVAVTLNALADEHDARPTYVVASKHEYALHYCRAVGAPRSWKIVIDAERLQAIGRGALLIIVDTGSSLRPGVADRLVVLEHQGTEIRWVNLDRVMGGGP